MANTVPQSLQANFKEQRLLGTAASTVSERVKSCKQYVILVFCSMMAPSYLSII